MVRLTDLHYSILIGGRLESEGVSYLKRRKVVYFSGSGYKAQAELATSTNI